MTITKIVKDNPKKPNFVIELSDDEARKLVVQLVMSGNYPPDIIISLGIAIKSNQLGIYQKTERQDDFNNIIAKYREQNPLLIGIIEAKVS